MYYTSVHMYVQQLGTYYFASLRYYIGFVTI